MPFQHAEGVDGMVGCEPMSMWDYAHPLHPVNESAFASLKAAALAARGEIEAGNLDPAIARRFWDAIVMQSV